MPLFSGMWPTNLGSNQAAWFDLLEPGFAPFPFSLGTKLEQPTPFESLKGDGEGGGTDYVKHLRMVIGTGRA